MGGWQVVRGWAPGAAMEFLARSPRTPRADDISEADLGVAQVVKRRPSRLILHIPGLGVLKVVFRLWWRGRLASLVRPVLYAREFDTAKRAAALGVPVAEPVFAAVRRRWGLAVQAAILLKPVPGAVTLEQLMRRNYPRLGRAGQPGDDVRGLMAQLGTAAARLHAAGGAHGDFAPRNVLISRDARQPLTLIDWADGWAPRIADCQLPHHHVEDDTTHGERRAAPHRQSGVPQCPKRARRDIGRLMSRLVRCGTPLRAVVAFLRSYTAARGFAPDQGRQLAEELAAASALTLRAQVGRVMRAATRGTRWLGVRAEGDHVLCYRKERDLGEIRSALAQPAQGLGAAALVARDERSDAREAWRTACALASLALPMRLHVACRFHRHTGAGRLLVENPPGAFESAAVRDGDDAWRLGWFVRLLHAYGFRFTTCKAGTILHQPDRAGPFVRRQGCGYLLGDPGAVTFAPDAGLGGSANVVAAWVQRHWGTGGAAAVRALGERPIRFRL